MAEVGRQRPGGGGPDDHIDRFSGQHRVFRGEVVLHGKLHEDGCRRIVLVFDFGLRQGGLAGEAPVDGLLAAHQAAVQAELHALAGDHGLVRVVHGEVGVGPVPHDPQPFELLALDVDEPFGIGPAEPAHLRAGEILLLLAQLLVHVVLDRKPVAIPARDVDGVETGHLPRAHDDVLQDLVERGADVDVPVGVGRTVVQDERLPALGGLPDLLEKPVLLPLLQLLRLAPGQIRFHRKRRRGQVQGLLVIHHILPDRVRARTCIVNCKRRCQALSRVCGDPDGVYKGCPSSLAMSSR